MKKKSKYLIILATVVALGLILYSVFNEKDSLLNGKTEVKVQLQWFDGAQFAGLYVAKEKGFFDDEDLIVDLIPIAGYTSDPISILTNGDADIALAPADRILIRKNVGDEIKAFGTVFNRSLACYTYKSEKTTNNDSLNILENKIIGVYKKFDTENILLSLIKKHNLNIKSENIVQAPGVPLEALKTNNIQVLGSYLINEPLKLNMDNFNVKYIDPAKFGVHFYSDTYIAKSEVWNRTNLEEGINKEVLIKFIRAVNKGWAYCKKNPEDAIDIMFKNITNKSKSENGEMELLSLREAIKYVGDGPNNQISYMKKSTWLNMEENLFNIKRLSQQGYIDDLCDFTIVTTAYEK